MLIPVIFHKIFVYSAATISVLANGTLLLLLFNKRISTLGTYRILLAVFALTDIFTSMFHAWYIPMFLMSDYGFIFFGYGTLLKSGPILWNVNLVYATVFHLPFCLLCLHFIYRYLILARPTLVRERFTTFAFLCIIYTVLFILGSESCVVAGSGRTLPVRFNEVLSEYRINGSATLNLFVVDYLDQSNLTNYEVIKYVIGSCSVCGQSILISILCIWKITKAINNGVMEIEARKLQFAVPVVLSLMPMTALFILPATGISLGQLGNVFGLIASTFPALDPILIIFSVGRFRIILKEWAAMLFGNEEGRIEREAIQASNIHSSIVV